MSIIVTVFWAIVAEFVGALGLFAPLAASITQPPAAHAPPGWYINGVHEDGSYELRHVPVFPEPRCAVTKERGRRARSDCNARVEPDIAIRSRIYCTGGQRAIIVDSRGAARIVGCQP